MASHVVGPLLVADRRLAGGERDYLRSSAVWTFALLASVPVSPGLVTASMRADLPLTARLTTTPVLSARLEITDGI